MRLQKYLALCGVASRRSSEALMLAGRVTVDGVVADTMGMQVEEGQVVCVDGKQVLPEARKYYILYHKPMGEVSTASDPEGRPTVLHRFRDIDARLYPVGRLDYDSEGLLLLTNDGELTQRLLHPSREVDKTYLARVEGVPGPEALHRMRTGIPLDGRMTAPAQVRVIRQGEEDAVILVTLHEGRNRQVRRMLDALGHRVLLLRRVQFGPLQLGELKRGQWRELTEEEVERLRHL
ncbi:MAG TPA: pseudouridine synthase [Clostridia bacterium]|nr:pseudouridine synthase [Clostridia bacterium]